MILIGPGTGLAPFRGFIQDRDNQRSSGRPIGEIVLFFGCRHRQSDFIYEQEILEYHTRGTISHLFLAFSRDQVIVRLRQYRNFTAHALTIYRTIKYTYNIA
jgi:NADPH-ferrihemoprotein reductase